jgi:tRNA (cmo5U34)-methyltransferase
MPSKDPAELFDQSHADAYDQRFVKLAPLQQQLHLLAKAAFGGLPADARILCVGAGTGAEMLFLASRFPGWRFVAVDPAAPMLAAARRKAEAAGVAERCAFHAGLLGTLPPGEPFDAATAILVSQFLRERAARVAFFREIARRLRPGGALVSADLAADLSTPDGRWLLEAWLRLMRDETGITAEQAENMRAAYARDVAVWPVAEVSGVIAEGGFENPRVFHQAGLIHAWHAVAARGTA